MSRGNNNNDNTNSTSNSKDKKKKTKKLMIEEEFTQDEVLGEEEQEQQAQQDTDRDTDAQPQNGVPPSQLRHRSRALVSVPNDPLDSAPSSSSSSSSAPDSSSHLKPISIRSYYHKRTRVISDSDSDADADGIRKSVPVRPHRHCAWLRRRHLLIHCLIFSLIAYSLSSLPPPELLSDLPPLSEYLPEELQSQWQRIHSLVTEGVRPGLKAKEEGIKSHFPVILIPGIISTALEVWEGEACARPHFRQRLWGSSLMLRAILLDSRCWIRHMTLDNATGMDPPGIKLRSSSGLEAADYIIGDFWVWAKIIENLADIGYDTNSMYMAAYDWRLAFKHLQIRDYYLSKLKAQMEIAKLSNGDRKVVIVTHSMGALLVHYFMKWVESPLGADAGDRWVSNHIESIVNIGGPMLGVSKAWSALFSGEMKDTAELAPFLDYWRQRMVFSQADVIQILRAVFSVPSMMPKGGNDIWGDEYGAPDDYFCKSYEQVTKILLDPNQDRSALDDDIIKAYTTERPELLQANRSKKHTKQETSQLRHENSADGSSSSSSSAVSNYQESGELAPPSGRSVGQSFSAMFEDSILRHPSRWFGSQSAPEEYTSSKGSERGLFVTLTGHTGEHADHCKDGCDMTLDEAMEFLRQTAPEYMNFTESLYSFGSNINANESDQKYWSNPLESPLPYAPNLKIYCFYGVGRDTERGYMYRHHAVPTSPQNNLVPHWSINVSHTIDKYNIKSGVKFTDGDGTVPLISLGFMCTAGWKHKALNPGNATVVTREYLEVNATMAILRAATSTDHVDIMGNSEIISDLLRVVGVKKKGAAADAGAQEKESAMKQRESAIDAENAGATAEAKGPKTSEERQVEQGDQQAYNAPSNDNAEAPCHDTEKQSVRVKKGHPPGSLNNPTTNADDDSSAEWVPTFPSVRSRILSCIREVSASADKRLLTKMKEKEKKAHSNN